MIVGVVSNIGAQYAVVTCSPQPVRFRLPLTAVVSSPSVGKMNRETPEMVSLETLANQHFPVWREIVVSMI